MPALTDGVMGVGAQVVLALDMAGELAEEIAGEEIEVEAGRDG